MPKLFILTLGKCQSRSFTAACQMLGLRSQQYPDDLEKAIETCDVVVGVELSNKYKELAKQYPDSKFLLLTREDKDWIDSFEQHDLRIKKAPKQDKIKRIRKGIFAQEKFNREVWLREKTKLENQANRFFKNKQERFLQIDPFGMNSDRKWKTLINFVEPKLLEKRPLEQEFPEIQ